MLRMALSLALCALLLTACAGGPGRTELVRLPIPDALLACAAAPDPPSGAYTQRSVALWIVELAASGDDCRLKLGQVGALERERRAAAKGE